MKRCFLAAVAVMTVLFSAAAAHAATLGVRELSPPAFSSHLVFTAAPGEDNEVTVTGASGPTAGPLGTLDQVRFSDAGRLIGPDLGGDDYETQQTLTRCAFALAVASCQDSHANTDIHLLDGDDTLSIDLGNRTNSWMPQAVNIYALTGNDTIRARDGWSEQIRCGDGADTVEADTSDFVYECENVIVG